MGTNFFLRYNVCPTCGHPRSDVHIGKNSAGWVFHFQSYPFANTLSDMKKLTQKGTIYDEYLEEYTYEDFWDIVGKTREPYDGQEPHVLVDPDYPNDIDFGSYEESGFAWTPREFC